MRYLNLCLLVLFPIAWFAPLMRAAVLPIFGMDEISVITGLQALWATDAVLALVVTFLAVFAPMAKVAGVALRTLEDLGFLREGYLRQRWQVGGELQDSVLMGLLASDWHSAR